MIDNYIERVEYTDFIKNLISSSHKYKRNFDTKSFSIAIDSPWGTGKTSFIKELKLALNSNGDITVSEYNAWKNDFCTNAFEPFIYYMINNDDFKTAAKNYNEFCTALAKVVKIIPALTKGLAFHYFEKAFGNDASELVKNIFNDAEDGLSELASGVKSWATDGRKSLFPEMETYLQSVELLKEMLTQYIKVTRNKIILIIDELDRCKPTFAIQTLEIAKHLFDVDGIVFIFALDIKQLSCSAKCLYGNDMNTEGYLMRFFDIVSKMPEISQQTFLENLTDNKMQELLKISNEEERNLFTGTFVYMVETLHLSLRDIETILSNFSIFADNTFNAFDHEVYRNYLGILCLKYKYSNYIEIIFGASTVSTETLQKSEILTRNCAKDITSNKKLKEIYYNVNGFNTNVCIDRVSNSKIWNGIKGVEYDKNVCLNEYITYVDLENWDNIKSLTVEEFILQKMECIRFLNNE